MTHDLDRPTKDHDAGRPEKTRTRSRKNTVLSRIDGWYVVRRTGQAVLVIALSYTITFFALFILPGNPIQTRIDSPDNPIPPTVAKSLLAYYHLNESGPQQFVLSLGRLLHNDWGYSLTSGAPVTELIGDAVPSTLALASTALVLAVIVALAVAALAVFSPSRQVRTFFESLPAFFLSVPSFLVGLLLLQYFSYQLGLVSAIQDQGFRSLILPGFTLGIAVSAPVSQVLIRGFKRTLKMPFVFVLRAQGNDEGHIIRNHVLKNGSIPAVTLLALTAGDLLAGSVVTEVVFNRQGLGSVTQQAVREQDTPVVLAVVLIVSFVFVLLSLLTDLIYPLLDPRIRVSQGIATEN